MPEAASPKAQKILIYLIREMITDRFKRLARDEALSKFIFNEIDPAALIDVYLQAEKEALQLSQKTLGELHSSTTLQKSLLESSARIHERLGAVYGSDFESGISSSAALESRARWLKSRMEFYSQWMSVESSSHTPETLARDAFKTAKNFKSKVALVLDSEKDLHESLLKTVPTTYRLLFKKQCEHELERARDLWEEFAGEVFKEVKQFPEI